MARSMVTRYAMVPELGSATYADESPGFLGAPAPLRPRLHSEQTAREIDLAVRRIVDDAFERALKTLERNRPVLEASAAELLARETLDEAALADFFEKLEPVEAQLGAPR
jgi:cell division protease FtsH